MVLTALFAVDISSSLQRVTSAVLTWFDLIVRLFSWGFDWVSAGFLPSGPQVPRAQGWSWTIVFNEATSWELLAICDWSYGQGQCPLFHFVWLLVGENRFHLFFCLGFCRQHRRSLAAPGVSGSANRRPGNACNTPSGAFIRSPLGLLFSFSFAVSWYLVFRFFVFLVGGGGTLGPVVLGVVNQTPASSLVDERGGWDGDRYSLWVFFLIHRQRRLFHCRSIAISTVRSARRRRR